MITQRLIHDAAWAAAMSIADLFRNVLRDDEVNEATQAIYERCRAGIEAMVLMSNREDMRLKPSQN